MKQIEITSYVCFCGWLPTSPMPMVVEINSNANSVTGPANVHLGCPALVGVRTGYRPGCEQAPH
ncbi:hypothetical protein [Mycobacterium sp. MAA66]|uniref:hypothetical protein n=1 Tax=Mycobacterium sp. MAA66 TaxID=3156297 RepID=UPI003514F922